MRQHKIIVMFTALMLTLMAGLFFSLSHAGHQHDRAYNQLNSQSTPTSTLEPELKTSHKEFSNNLSKNIWINNPSHRQAIYLQSKGADLDFIKYKDKVEIMENMKQVKIWVQEEVFYHNELGERQTEESQIPMQQVLILESQEAIYHWNHQAFICQDALITRYIAPGHQLSPQFFPENKQILLQGKAKKATLNFKNKKVAFNARHLKASILR